MTAKELREKRAAVFAKMREMTDKITKEGRDFTAEEKPGWEAVNKEYDDFSSRITVAERMEKAESEQREAAGEEKERRERAKRDGARRPAREDFDAENHEEEGDEDERSDEMTDAELGISETRHKPEVFAMAVQGWMRAQSGLDVEQRHIKAARLSGVNLRRKYIDIQVNRRAMTPKEFRALSAVDTTLGAGTVAPSFSNAFETAMLAFGPMRQVAQVIRTETGAEMPWPTANDTSNEGHLLGENAAATTGDPAFGLLRWFAHKYTSDIIKVPTELMEDSAFDLVTEIGRMCGERVSRRQNRDFTTGDGAAKPRGIVTAATLGVTTAGATAITADEIVGLIHSVDPSYRQGAKLMFHDNLLLYIRKLKDSQNRYLFQDAAAGAPPTIWGAPYEINQHMQSTVATATKTVIYGQLDKYKIRDVRTIRMRRLVERYADADQEGFVAFFRSDGNLLDAGVAPVKYMLQA